MKRRSYLVTIGVIASFAGCTASSDPSEESDSDMAPTTTSYSGDVPSYGDLSNKSQQVFKRLLKGESVTGADSDFPSDLWQADYIRYNGTVYAIKREQTFQSISEYHLHTEYVNKTTIRNEPEVIRFDQLSPSAQAAFETARYEGVYKTRERLPDQLVEYEYVNYEKEYYKLDQVTGDLPEWEISAVPPTEDHPRTPDEK